MITTFVMPLVRHGATALATYLVTSGIIDAGMQETAAGVAIGLAALVASIYEKRTAKATLAAAKAGS